MVSETHGYGLQRLGPALDARADDPIAAIAANLHSSQGPRSFADPAALLASAADAARADAVVLWLTREDEAAAWHVPALRSLCADRHLPLLELTARHWECDDGTLEEIADFVGRTRA